MQDTGAYHHSLHRTLQENPYCSPCNHATHDSCALLFDNVQKYTMFWLSILFRLAQVRGVVHWLVYGKYTKKIETKYQKEDSFYILRGVLADVFK